MKYNLEERLLEFSIKIIRLTETMYNTKAGNHVAGQLLRSGTAPYPNHGEAQSAESANDFIHKLKISLKELRETQRWLVLIKKTPLTNDLMLTNELLSECDELIRIFVSSIKTTRQNNL